MVLAEALRAFKGQEMDIMGQRITAQPPRGNGKRSDTAGGSNNKN
nr:MAG TPA: hypothetical protein [Caudoviricetes sp.]